MWDKRQGDVYVRSTDAITQQGVAAYAARQANMKRQLVAKCRRLWEVSSNISSQSDPTTSESLGTSVGVTCHDKDDAAHDARAGCDDVIDDDDDDDDELRIEGDRDEYE